MKGVYIIISPTNKVYIGEANDIEKRWNRYRNLDCKKQSFIYRSFVKHGVENHQFHVWHELPNATKLELHTYEDLYVEYFRNLGFDIMTLKTGSGNYVSEETRKKISLRLMGNKYTLGHKLTDEHKKKLSKSHLGNKSNLGRKLSEEHKKNIGKGGKGRQFSNEHKMKIGKALSKSIIQFTKQGGIVRGWDSIRQAEKELNIDHSYISKAAKGKIRTAGGFIWKYKNIA